ncbi:MAG: hypothetical protein ACRYHQ_02030 [Janthinobacterium lividum]
MARIAKGKFGTPATFTVAQVETMLRAAGAREPWLQPRQCESLRLQLNQIAREAAGPDPIADFNLLGRRAHDAAADLRRIVERFLPIYEAPPQEGDLIHFVEFRHKHAKKLRTLIAALDALDGEPIRYRIQKPNALFLISQLSRRRPTHARWAPHAKALFYSYGNMVGSGTKSRNGPAARFIADALNRAGFAGFGPVDSDASDPALKRKRSRKPITAAAVEGALRRPG